MPKSNKGAVIPFAAFESVRPHVIWRPMIVKKPYQNAEQHELSYVGFLDTAYGVTKVPYFLMVFVFNAENMSVDVSLYANLSKDAAMRNQSLIEKKQFSASRLEDVQQAATQIMERYNIHIGAIVDKIAEAFHMMVQDVQKVVRDIQTSQEPQEPWQPPEDINLYASGESILMKQADYSSWYAGQLPSTEFWQQYIGTSSVDTSQIASRAGGNVVSQAVNMVNSFNPNLLRNVAVIFDFSNAGAYGVYVPELDEAIKQEKVKSLLKQEGLTVEDLPNKQGFAAYSNELPPDDIQKKIDQHENEIKNIGGTIFGLNMNKVYEAATRDIAQGHLTQDDLQDVLTLHVGATMVHEAVHAAGSQSEGPSENAELQFMQSAANIINQKRTQQNKAPLQITPHRSGSASGWYKAAMKKEAQYGAQFLLQTNPAFTDSSGGMPPWAGMLWDAGVGPIESMLGLKHQNQKGEALEKQLRKKDAKQIPSGIEHEEHIEDALQKDRSSLDGYKLTEELLDDRRPKPLAFMVKGAANGMTKLATFFGWMNNLDLPMRERMDEYDEGNGFLAFDWDAIRKQFRYNPEYDDNGFGLRWLEPRFQPELWDQMLADRPGTFTSPARRFGAKQEANEAQTHLMLLLASLDRAKSLVGEKKILGTRFIVSDDLAPYVSKYLSGDSTKTVALEKTTDGLIPIWLVHPSINEGQVANAEKYVAGAKEHESDFDSVAGISSIRKQTIEIIIDTAREIAKKYGISDVFIVGGFPRALVMKESWKNIRDLDFSSAWPDECLKLGELLAAELKAENIELFHRTMTLSWEWAGVKCDFRGHMMGATPMGIRALMREHNIPTTPVHLDIYARDFTMNMMMYSIYDGKIYDVTKKAVADIRSRVINTIFDPTAVLPLNPIIILRALKYAVRYGFSIDEDLSRSMKATAQLLFDGRYSDERLQIGFQDILKESLREEGEKLVDMYGLQRLRELPPLKELACRRQ